MSLPPSPPPSTTAPTLSVAGIAALAADRGERPLWRHDSGERSWTHFAQAVGAAEQACRAAGVAPGEVVLTPGDDGFAALAWLLGVAATGAVAAPLRRDRAAEADGWRTQVHVAWEVAGDTVVAGREGAHSPAAERLLARLRADDRPGLILGTGGTTGTPKLVLHDLTRLLAAQAVRTGPPRRVLPLMRFDHIGGLDMGFRALARGQVLVAPPPELTPASVAAAVARHRVEVLPATPSFLNLLLVAEVARHHDLGSLRTVPYGAEPMPAGLLARLRTAFPAVDFVQRFGTSETGALPVRDTGTGLLLPPGPSGFAWKVVGQELWVRSATQALGYLAGGPPGFADDGWFRTGDVADELPDGSVRILGRREELINVGGEKVLPSEVEGLLLGHPLVADCRVTSAPNAILGRVVAADVVWREPAADPVAVKRALHEFAAGRLPRHKLPAVVRLVPAVDTTRNLKKARLPSP